MKNEIHADVSTRTSITAPHDVKIQVEFRHRTAHVTKLRQTKRPPASQAFGALAVFHRTSTRALRRHDERTVKIVEIVRKQAANGITVEQLARDFGVTRRLIEMRFREATGHSIRDEIQSIRLERAKALLFQNRSSLAEIAAAAGYPSVQAFRKTFTAATGKPPLNWRKAQSA